MAEVKLIGMWASPFVRRIQVALELKGVEYEYVEEDLANKSELLLKYNPVHKKVPVLVHKGKPIAESLVILEYIDEIWKNNPILPQDPYQRANARFWAKFIEEKCVPALWQAAWGKGEEREKAMEEACQNLKILENELKNKKFFGGESIGLVDLTGNFIAHWLVDVIEEAAGVELVTKEKFPVLWKWIDEVASCTTVRKNLPNKEKLVEFFRARFSSGSWKY
ncbi:hypothetical protein K2173_019437 [Erythroxylum novogranatense]|uniref:glutathione transferase n=1 Tax=Erythroxylum novogranatense TaxID=1862640 RepID=A0AAV8UF85_9ROSI|nr:hypothetical protein K2173_019437 [Erythroxylum novogranatense]